MRRLALQILFMNLMLFAVVSAQQDSAAYRSAAAISDPLHKINALHDFLKQYPDSKLRTRAFDGLFDLHVEQGDVQGALEAADNSLRTLVPANRMSTYNRFAFNLAKNNMGLDSALVYVDRAIDMAGTSRNLSGYQDTKAYVLFRLGRFVEAEELQRIAIKGHEDDPEYLSNLALYENANGKVQDALQTMAKALYYGADQESKQHFLDWIDRTEKEPSKRGALEQTVFMSAVRSLTDTLTGSSLISARSNAATVMADLGIDLHTARLWSETAVKSLNQKSPVNDVVLFRQSLALVLSAQGKHKDALAHLQSVESLVDPYESRYWLTLGKTHEQLGNRRSAIIAYMSGLVARNEKALRTALETAYAQHYGSVEGIEKELDSMKLSSTHLEPGHYGKSSTPHGKVILAELFTGAECGPCASSDLAFDALTEYYPRSVLAILEYHVHIPGPDPMTTDESWDRYSWYAGQGTPTVVIDGRESIIGGGPKTVTRNRFGVYQFAIRKFEVEKPRARLSLSIKRDGDEIAATIGVAGTASTGRTGRSVVHVALLERSVDYTGANGISKHAFVVRRMMDDANGTDVSLQQKETILNKRVNVAEVEQRIKEYLDNPSAQRSWSYRRPFTGWRARPEKLDGSNLAIIAWVQDVGSKEVLQAIYQDVPALIGTQ
ncbi:MAG: hypothetical protein KIT50_10695 [Bacteroidetes bacterium]|nr:hypothetical protein [Bacteroidota bacterium]